MSKIPFDIVYDYKDEENKVCLIPEYVSMYLKRFNIINPANLIYVASAKNGEKDFYMPVYAYRNKRLSISHNDLPADNRTWYLKHHNVKMASIGPNVIEIRRKMEGIDIPQNWTIEADIKEDSISIKCSVLNGMSFKIEVARVFYKDSELGYIEIRAYYEDENGNYKINIHQSFDDRFFEPHNYLDYIAVKISFVKRSKNIKNDLFECGLIHDVAKDPRIVKKMKSLMPGDLLDFVDIEEESSVHIKSDFNRK